MAGAGQARIDGVVAPKKPERDDERAEGRESQERQAQPVLLYTYRLLYKVNYDSYIILLLLF